MQEPARRYIADMKIGLLSLLATLSMATLPPEAKSNSIVGTWVLTAADKLSPDGTRTLDYGESPRGLIIFTSDGHYSVQIYRADRTRFSSGDKSKGTPAEYRDASLGMSVHYGQYTVDPEKHTITFQIDRASFPNWDGTTQTRQYELKGDELSWRGAARPNGSIPITVVRRVH